MIGEKWPFVPDIFEQTDPVGVKSQIFYLFSLVATQP